MRLTRGRATAAVAATAALVPALALGATTRWQKGEALPLPRTEVAAARNGNELVVVGGYLPWGDTSAQADAYSPAQRRWRRLPDLPVAVNHAMAATWRGKAVVAGGYTGRNAPSDRAFVLEAGDWRELPRLPQPRAAGGAAVIRDTLYVVAGVGPNGLARTSFALDLTRNRWRTIPSPTPREHLAVAATGGRVYALAGRTAGLDTNRRTLESWAPGARRWTTLPRVPASRGGTGATAVGRTIVSIGGEQPGGTIASVYAYETRTRRWRRLPDLPTPRHGLGVVATGRSVYAIAGGPQPGLTTSGAVEFFTLP
ncbi:MAG TPA: kelch repeat-containing protein [Gaiellaceae bacterium]|nr:kelch repeat-containing protein [Gaiellaceae bacterium]